MSFFQDLVGAIFMAFCLVFVLLCLYFLYTLWRSAQLEDIVFDSSVPIVQGVTLWTNNGRVYYAGDLTNLPRANSFEIDGIRFLVEDGKIVYL